MKDSEYTEQEQAVLAAARSLGELQLQDIQKARRIKAAEEKKALAEAELGEAEFELAQADLDYATAKVRALTAQRALNKHAENGLPVYQVSDDARRRLWTLASSSDDDAILKAAREYGAGLDGYWQYHAEKDRLTAQHEQAAEAWRLSGEARKGAVQKRGRAKSAVEAAEQELNQAHALYPHGSMTLFNHENHLADAAEELTGSHTYAYSYAYTADLPIEVDEERLQPPTIEHHPYTPRRRPPQEPAPLPEA